MSPQLEHNGAVRDRADQVELRRPQLGEVLDAIRGADSHRLLHEVAELSTRNAALVWMQISRPDTRSALAQPSSASSPVRTN